MKNRRPMQLTIEFEDGRAKYTYQDCRVHGYNDCNFQLHTKESENAPWVRKYQHGDPHIRTGYWSDPGFYQTFGIGDITLGSPRSVRAGSQPSRVNVPREMMQVMDVDREARTVTVQSTSGVALRAMQDAAVFGSSQIYMDESGHLEHVRAQQAELNRISARLASNELERRQAQSEADRRRVEEERNRPRNPWERATNWLTNRY